PIRKVAPPIRLTVVRNAPLRPSRSPTMPKISAPNGRKAKAAAKSASAAIVPAVGFSPAKKTFWIVVASEPKMKKSYHSNAVPVDDAAITRAIDQVRCCGCSAIVAICAPVLLRDSSAAVSVQLADHAVDAGELEPELARVDMVGERSPVEAELQLLDDVQVTVLHHITDGRRVTGDGDIDRAGSV